jgi:hypothetical protein
MYKIKKWNKTKKNHYPDSDWVWQQLENNTGVEEFYNKLDKKYHLSDQHGNKGKKHKSHKNPWEARRNGGYDS